MMHDAGKAHQVYHLAHWHVLVELIVEQVQGQ